ncbi:hypothetical protein FRC01_002370 [Tulasnella sp. 417]|nr:hypothetical protein FRC01_002370 [Tulasnella sp. 417]
MLNWDKVKNVLKRQGLLKQRPAPIRPYKPPPISDKKPHPQPGYWETTGSPLLVPPSGKESTINESLPFELLLDIFILIILQAETPSQCILKLSLVCRHWAKAARRLELMRVDLRERPNQVDRLLDHIGALGDDGTADRSRIRVLEVKAPLYRDFHRLPEVLAHARPSVNELRLDRSGFNNRKHVPILSGLEPHPVDEPEIFTTTRDPDVIFPRLRRLHLEAMLAYEVVHLIACCDRTQLESIHLANIQFPTSPDIPPVLQHRTFPNLRKVIFDGRLPKDNPLPAYFFSAAPLLEQMGLVITTFDLDDTVKLLKDHAPPMFTHPQIVVKLEMRQGLETDDPCLVELSELIEERGWKRDIRRERGESSRGPGTASKEQIPQTRRGAPSTMYPSVKDNVSSFADVGTSNEPADDLESASSGGSPSSYKIPPTSLTCFSIDQKCDIRVRHSTLSRGYSGPLINILPPEILIEIFKVTILEAWDSSYKTMADLSLVCRSWKEAGLGLMLYRVSITSPKQMDALLGYLPTTPNFQETGRAPVQFLSVETEYQKDFHRLSELLALCRTSLQLLHLRRFFTSVPISELLQDARQEAESKSYFPKLTALCLVKFTPRELISFITSVNPLTLEHLELHDTFLRFDYILPDELATLSFPRLKEIVIEGYARPENPTISWLCQIAPNLEMLELSIVRERLPNAPEAEAEILIEIFTAVILNTWELSHKVMKNVSLVCRSWREAGRGMELMRVGTWNSKQVDAILGHIHTTPLFQERNRASIQILSVQTDYQKDFHRLPELLTLCRTSLRQLNLGRSSTNVQVTELLPDARAESGSEVYFPNLTSLTLLKFTPRELISFIKSVDPLNLGHLKVRDTFLWYDYILPEELAALRFTRLKEIAVEGYARPENPTIRWLCQIAPNLEMLELSILRERLPILTEFLASDRIPKTLRRPRVWVRIDKYDHLDPDSPDMAPLVQLIKERGWKQWICVHMSCGSWVYE